MTTDTTLAPTPGPWTVYSNRVCVWVYAPDGKPVCKVDDAVRIEARANAEFIVRACNAHADMLDALRMAARHVPADALEYSEGTHGDRVYPADVIAAAIARAEGR